MGGRRCPPRELLRGNGPFPLARRGEAFRLRNGGTGGWTDERLAIRKDDGAAALRAWDCEIPTPAGLHARAHPASAFHLEAGMPSWVRLKETESSVAQVSLL